jgi:hypothetical protein
MPSVRGDSAIYAGDERQCLRLGRSRRLAAITALGLLLAARVSGAEELVGNVDVTGTAATPRLVFRSEAKVVGTAVIPEVAWNVETDDACLAQELSSVVLSKIRVGAETRWTNGEPFARITWWKFIPIGADVPVVAWVIANQGSVTLRPAPATRGGTMAAQADLTVKPSGGLFQKLLQRNGERVWVVGASEGQVFRIWRAGYFGKPIAACGPMPSVFQPIPTGGGPTTGGTCVGLGQPCATDGACCPYQNVKAKCTSGRCTSSTGCIPGASCGAQAAKQPAECQAGFSAGGVWQCQPDVCSPRSGSDYCFGCGGASCSCGPGCSTYMDCAPNQYCSFIDTNLTTKECRTHATCTVPTCWLPSARGTVLNDCRPPVTEEWCGDNRRNFALGEDCDPPGSKDDVRHLVCGADCKWTKSIALVENPAPPLSQPIVEVLSHGTGFAFAKGRVVAGKSGRYDLWWDGRQVVGRKAATFYWIGEVELSAEYTLPPKAKGVQVFVAPGTFADEVTTMGRVHAGPTRDVVLVDCGGGLFAAIGQMQTADLGSQRNFAFRYVYPVKVTRDE